MSQHLGKLFVIRWTEQSTQRATLILKLRRLHKPDDDLKFSRLRDTLIKASLIFCDTFTFEEVVAITRCVRIGTYLMSYILSNNVMQKGSTFDSFSQRLKEYLKRSKLKRSSEKDLMLHSSYPYSEASDGDKEQVMCKPKG